MLAFKENRKVQNSILLRAHFVRPQPPAGYSFLTVRPGAEQLAKIAELLQNEIIRPLIDQRFPFDQAKEALAYLDKGRAKGKVFVRMK